MNQLPDDRLSPGSMTFRFLVLTFTFTKVLRWFSHYSVVSALHIREHKARFKLTRELLRTVGYG